MVDAPSVETVRDAADELSTRTERPVAVGGAALLTVVAFVAFAGLPGAVAAMGVVAAWYLLDSTYAFALGQVGVAALASDAALLRFAVLEAGLFGLLLVPLAVDDGDPAETEDGLGRVAVALAWTAAAGLAAWASAVGAVDLPAAASAVVAATALAAYGLHRYLHVELVDAASEYGGTNRDERM